ncbi:histidine kinase dimerization/phospho-acceptor domain-containing protein [Chloroflexota bacterium]
MDITERKRGEEALLKSEQELSVIFQTSSDAMKLIDTDFNVLRVNTAYEELYQMDSATILAGKCYDTVRANRCLTKECPLVLTKATGERMSYETEIKRQDGKKLDCILTISPVTGEGGEIIGVLEDFVDITERKRMEQELINKTEEVERADRLKSEFLANMSHELRTPLNVIIGFSELMLEGVPGKINSEQRQCLADTLTSSQHLLELINGVLDLSSIESGKGNSTREMWLLMK